MGTPAVLIAELSEKVENYAKTSFELSKLKSLETLTSVATTLIAKLSVILVLSLFSLILNIAIALYLGELLGKSYFGFLIVSSFYLILGIVLHFFLHKWIKKPLSDLIISQALQ